MTERLVAFVGEAGRMPAGADDIELTRWVTSCRDRARGGQVSASLEEALLRVPGWCWQTSEAPLGSRDVEWAQRYDEVAAFIAANGHVPSSTDSVVLANWVQRNRATYRSAKMTPARVVKLEAIPGWWWDATTRVLVGNGRWSSPADLAVAAGIVAAHVRSVGGFVDVKSGPLHHAARTLRVAYQRGEMDADVVATLEGLNGWSWPIFHVGRHPVPASFDVQMESVLAFVAAHGRLPLWRPSVEGERLAARAVGALAKAHRRGALSDIQARRVALALGDRVTDMAFAARVTQLRSFLESTGRMPGSNPTAATRPEISLASFVRTQRTKFADGSLLPGPARALAAIPGWVWEPRLPSDVAWDAQFAAWEKLVEESGCMPGHDGDDNESALWKWARVQNAADGDGLLSADRRARLCAHPRWVFYTPRYCGGVRSWSDSFAEMCKFVAVSGRWPVYGSPVRAEARLYAWVNRQHSAYRRGVLKSEHAQLLGDVPGWMWRAGRVRCAPTGWFERFRDLERFVAAERALPVAGVLVRWCERQRCRQRDGGLSARARAHLETVPGWYWECGVAARSARSARLHASP